MVTMTDSPIINRINAENEAKGLGTLGYLVWWSLTDVQLSQSDAEALVSSLGMDAKRICPQIEARGGIKKSLEALGFRASPQSGKKSDTDPTGRYFYDRIADSEASVVVTITERVVTDNGNGPVAVFNTVQRITYDRTAKAITLSTPFLENEIRSEFQKWTLTYRSNEVRQIIQRILETAKSITVRESGGIYFTPESAGATLTKLHALTKAITGASLVSLGITDTPESKREMRVAAGAEIQRELDAALDDLKTLTERKIDGVSIRDATLKTRLENYNVLKTKAIAYADLVGLEVEAIQATLAKLSDEVQALF